MNSLYFSTFTSPIGKITVFIEDNKLIRLDFDDSYIRRNSKKYTFIEDKKKCKKIEEELMLYFKGKLKKFTIPLHCEGSVFQKKVWNSLQKIPYGTVISYKQLANNCGNSNAHRACANANGKNPLPIIIPCHRVIYTNGKLGGYSSGIHIKKQLLEIEGVSPSYYNY